MRFLEVRRHTIRAKPGQHLSQAGVTLARQIGETMGPFDRVIASAAPRAFETAIAMGFAVDEQLEQLGLAINSPDNALPWPESFAGAARAIQEGGGAAVVAHDQADEWRSIVTALPDGGHALVIGHGGIIELGAVACLPNADHASWGPACECCEGIRLAFDGKDFIGAEILRVKVLE